MSTFTIAKNLEQVPRGVDLGTWDSPTNSNWGIVDAALGQAVTIGLNNSNVVLSTPQYQCNLITFNSTLTGNVSITFPTSFTGPYSVQNLCTGFNFTVTLGTTVAGGQVICAPPGSITDVFNNGVDLKYRNLGRIGEYVDVALTVVPGWISGCTVPPYLNCDGTTFNATTYPVLNAILGGNTLPDSRGRTRYAADAGTNRITTVIGAPNTVGGAGGGQTITVGTSNLPAYTPSGTVAVTAHTVQQVISLNVTAGGTQLIANGGNLSVVIDSQTFTGNAQGGISAPMAALPPLFIHGITMIRAG